MRKGFWGVLVMLRCATTPRPADRLIVDDIMEPILLEKAELGRCVAQQWQRDPGVLLQWRILPSGVTSERSQLVPFSCCAVSSPSS